MSVIVGGAAFFAAGMVCLILAVWKTRVRTKAVAAAPARVRAADGSPARVASRMGPASRPAHRAPAAPAPQESYYAQAPPSRAKGRPMGWYSVEGSLSDERFWDGQAWTARRQLVEGSWAPVPLAG